VARATQKASAARRAVDYKLRQTMVRDISPALAMLTLLDSSKFRYFEESLAQPFNNVQSISEGKMMQLLTEDSDEHSLQLRELNKHHLTRIYPSRQKQLRNQSSNFNPVLPWSLGCQIASMNQQVCDAFVLVNDGRFRANGSCGYVLKPDSMIERKGHFTINGKPQLQAKSTPTKWQFKVLSGSNLPKPRKKALAGTLNPRVRVTLYDGGTTDPVVHLSSSVEKNGLNPVWNETKGAIFDDVKDPDTAIVMFSLWDFDGLGSSGSEDFIAAAAIPLSCMREGYRSVPLFDSNHMRCGAHAFTSLFIRVDAL
jgi:phosphatidylinositol phospholipase C delta